MREQDRAEGRKWLLAVVLVVAAAMVLGLAAITARHAMAAAPERHYLSAAQSLDVLRTAFGRIAERPIREGRVVVVATTAEIADLSDDVNIANGARHPRTGAPWARGVTNSLWPLGIRGFTDVATGDVYINGEVAIETTTPHEMLHSNSSFEFLETLGLALYEGTTEQAALDALASSGLRRPAAPEYPRERTLVADVIEIAGRDRLLRAYFNGGADLAALVDALGSDAVAKAKGATAGGDIAAARRALRAASPTLASGTLPGRA